jgi:hypothetical protein
MLKHREHATQNSWLINAQVATNPTKTVLADAHAIEASSTAGLVSV